ncbi:hypothetical protein TREVI0001_2056 [Treponema vincentii ATCC 35580]|uniref:Uncharacterized protein n=1 Tax=Treponema vincentii ATCC 35580 TaxID=596324 RepID=C8PQF2_9SPIR|nr:hypothetical protein TREVI0001_2056 [Treponema vincentii ATCC 35580]
MKKKSAAKICSFKALLTGNYKNREKTCLFMSLFVYLS